MKIFLNLQKVPKIYSIFLKENFLSPDSFDYLFLNVIMDEKVDEHQQQEEVNRRAEERYNEIVTKAVNIPGTSDSCDLNKIPEWFDAKKYERCIYLARKYFVR